ncbi:MAG: hypothetical protein HC769_28560 [Cyanobacteria bacterium CRU_2_1]|nr:hypothetical protein [Cyanobacteria bacterium CRU_2_1]
MPRQEIDLITQSETGESLAGVKIQFIAQGAPEVQFTDSNGYAKVQIPSKGDVRVNLSKSGYPVQDFIINLENTQSTVRVIRFSQSGQPNVQQVVATPTPTDTPTPTPTSTPPVPEIVPVQQSVENNGLKFDLQNCQRNSSAVTCNLLVTNTGDEDRKLELHGSYSNAPSRVVDFSGNEYKAVAAQAGQDQNAYTASVNLIRDVPIRASVKFELPVEVATLRFSL